MIKLIHAYIDFLSFPASPVPVLHSNLMGLSTRINYFHCRLVLDSDFWWVVQIQTVAFGTHVPVVIPLSLLNLSETWDKTLTFSFVTYFILLVSKIVTPGLASTSVQFNSVTWSCQTLCNPMDCGTPGLPDHHQLPELLKLMSIESVMPSNHLILCRPLLLLPSIFPTIRVFLNESVLCIRWPKYWSFNFIISPSNEYSQLISFRIDWLDLLAI